MRILTLTLTASLIIYCAGNFPSQTEKSLNQLDLYGQKTLKILKCVGEVQTKFEKALDFIEKLHALEESMEELIKEFEIINSALSSIGTIPLVGEVVALIEKSLKLVSKLPLTAAHNAVKNYDEKYYILKGLAKRRITTCIQANMKLTPLRATCALGKTTLEFAKGCVQNMKSNSDSTKLGKFLETSADFMNKKYGKLDKELQNMISTCADVNKNLANSLKYRELNSVLNFIHELREFLKPISNYLVKVQTALQREIGLGVTVEQTLRGINLIVNPCRTVAEKIFNDVVMPNLEANIMNNEHLNLVEAITEDLVINIDLKHKLKFENQFKQLEPLTKETFEEIPQKIKKCQPQIKFKCS